MQRRKLVAEKVKKAREELGWSQEALGKLFGVSDAHISRLEKGIVGFDVDDVERLAHILGKPLAWFYAGEVSLPPRPPEAALSELENSIRAFIPVYAEVSAGSGVFPADYIAVTRSKPALESLIAYRVKGLCLDPEVQEGDTLIVDRERAPQNGNLVVVIIEDKASVKRYRDDGQGQAWLENHFGRYRPEEVFTIGVVINLDRPMV